MEPDDNEPAEEPVLPALPATAPAPLNFDVNHMMGMFVGALTQLMAQQQQQPLRQTQGPEAVFQDDDNMSDGSQNN
jgi:hypothetical protein